MVEQAPPDADDAQERIDQIQEDIAESLAFLSNESETPTSFPVSPTPFHREDVDFMGTGWMYNVAEVQRWLGIPDRLPEGDSTEFLSALSADLGFEDLSEATVAGSDPLALNEVALDRLRMRADRAVSLQQLFLTELQSDGGSRPSATRAWEAAWLEDDTEDEVASPEPVSAKADTWRIEQFVVEARDGKLNLAPSYQRGDVWGTSSRQLLIESILRGIPLPSVILLKSPDSASRGYEVVDGKQRLTSILRFVGRHPLAIARLDELRPDYPDLVALFETDYPRFKKEWKRIFHEPLTAALEEKYYFPFRLRNDPNGLPGEELAAVRGKYYSEIRHHEIQVADEQVAIQYVFERSTEYKIPVIVYGRANQRQIHEVFKLYNKQGTHLNAEEIRNAIFHDLTLTKAMLATAGDFDSALLSDIAPCLMPVWDEIQHLPSTLREYGFGDSRYRRTKVLSWVVATLLLDTGEKLSSTAKHIDSLLERVQADKNDPLRVEDRIAQLFVWIAQSSEVHAASEEAWAPTFRDGDQGIKWQELQLVGSLVGVAIAALTLGEALEDAMADAAPSLHEATKSLSRPENVQSKTQWVFISQIAQAVVRILGVDPTEASTVMQDRFGSSGIETLWSVAPNELTD